MDPLVFAWVVALIVTVGGLFPGAIRTLAYRSGQIDHTPTMRTAAIFAVALGLVGLVCLVALSVVLLTR
jgi:hypothetical protein